MTKVIEGYTTHLKIA